MLCQWKNTAHPDRVSIKNNNGGPFKRLAGALFFVGFSPTVWQTIKIKIYLIHITEKKSEIALFYRAIEKHKNVWVGGRHVTSL